MILGIDVSTSKIGYCVIDSKQNLVEVQFKKLKEDTLEERASEFFCCEMQQIKRKYVKKDK